MNVVLFDTPISVLCPQRHVTKIRCAKDGFDFLLTCPVQEGPIFESALEVCFAALGNPSLTADAKRGFALFARIHGVLANEAKSFSSNHKLRFASRNLRASRDALSHLRG